MKGRTPSYAWVFITLLFLLLAFAAAAPGSDEGPRLYPVVVEGKWGYIDREGSYVIEPRFDEAKEFTEGIARVKPGTKTGYIDKTGRYVWNPAE